MLIYDHVPGLETCEAVYTFPAFYANLSKSQEWLYGHLQRVNNQTVLQRRCSWAIKNQPGGHTSSDRTHVSHR